MLQGIVRGDLDHGLGLVLHSVRASVAGRPRARWSAGVSFDQLTSFVDSFDGHRPLHRSATMNDMHWTRGRIRNGGPWLATAPPVRGVLETVLKINTEPQQALRAAYTDTGGP